MHGNLVLVVAKVFEIGHFKLDVGVVAEVSSICSAIDRVVYHVLVSMAGRVIVGFKGICSVLNGIVK